MTLTVNVPEGRRDAIVENLRSRGAGSHPSTTRLDQEVAIKMDAPLVHLLDYGRDLAALTGGAGRFDLAFKVYRPLMTGPGFDPAPDLFPPAAAMRA
jgi:translation elongation factor EF-G